ncbi:DNA-binding response regulator [Chrysiogenes arsenatis]|uniref:DNA-binding response regulator n=1 Tax=Chrysiogenes arsenatis TaxID=309797 RepID=UPI0003F69284|nr:winged helix-turn-helix domain-containing protein [Chrysiogenes arsenatis]
MSGERILILDDNAKQLDLLGKYLGKYGYKTLLCGKLAEALAIFAERDDIRIIMCASSGTAQNLQTNYDTLFAHAPELPLFLFAPKDYVADTLPEHHEHIALPLQLPALVQRIKNTLRTLRYSGRSNVNRNAEPTPQQNGAHSASEQPYAARDRRPMSQQPRRHESPRRDPIALPPTQLEALVAVESAPAPTATPAPRVPKPPREKPAAKAPQPKREARPPREAKPKLERESAVAVIAATPTPPIEVPEPIVAEPVAAPAPVKKTRAKRQPVVPSEIEPIFPKSSMPLTPSLLETVSKKPAPARSNKHSGLLETFTFPTVKLTLDRQKEELLIEGEAIALSTTEYILMKYLLENRNRVLSRDEILHDSHALNPETSPRNVDTAIRKLRRKLGDDTREQPLIQTIWGVGYLLQDKSKRKPRS